MFYDKLFDKCIYGVTTVRSGRKQIPQRKNDKQMKQGDVDFKYSDNVYVLNDIIGPTLR